MGEVLKVVDGVVLVFESPAEETAQELQLFLHGRVPQSFRLSKKVVILCQPLLAEEIANLMALPDSKRIIQT